MLHTAARHDGLDDRVAIEEPMEIRVRGAALAVTMRTPGHDEELAVGFLVGEGLLAPGPVPVGPSRALEGNVVEVDAPLLRELGARRFYTSSSCGVCGKGALEEVAALTHGIGPAAAGPRIARELLASLPGRLEQPGFAATGGLHATGLFTATGESLLVREDVGRHNAMDKVIGRCALDDALPLTGLVLCVSGRLSFELVQKALVAGVSILVGAGAPTSLAVSLALEHGLTLAGFARGDGRVNVYSGAERVLG